MKQPERLQTNTFGGDADWFLQPGDPASMDISFGADEVPTSITSGQWYRLVLTRTAGELFRGYVDGVLVSDGTWNAFAAGDVDFRIDSEFRPFSDDDGEYNDMQINALAYWDETLPKPKLRDLWKAAFGSGIRQNSPLRRIPGEIHYQRSYPATATSLHAAESNGPHL